MRSQEWPRSDEGARKCGEPPKTSAWAGGSQHASTERAVAHANLMDVACCRHATAPSGAAAIQHVPHAPYNKRARTHTQGTPGVLPGYSLPKAAHRRSPLMFPIRANVPIAMKCASTHHLRARSRQLARHIGHMTDRYGAVCGVPQAVYTAACHVPQSALHATCHVATDTGAPRNDGRPIAVSDATRRSVRAARCTSPLASRTPFAFGVA